MKTRPLYQILDELNRSIYLPHIQRPFVWSENQVRRLFDSLMRGYPIQTFLFWKTEDEIKARRFMDRVEPDLDLHSLYDLSASKAGLPRCFVLDGQQRLQGLRTIFDGGLVAKHGVLEAWIDLASGVSVDEDLFWYGIKFASDSPGVTWYRVPDLRGVHARLSGTALGRQESRRIAPSLEAMESGRRDEILDRVQENCAQMVKLLRDERVLWYDELDGVVGEFTYDRVLEVFVRVNNGGTKLDGSDLMFAAMKGLSSDIEQDVEELAADLRIGDLRFDKGWVLKAIVTAITGDATLSPQRFAGSEGDRLMPRIRESWSRLEEAFEQLHDLILFDIQTTSDRLIRSYAAIIPLFDYLYHFPSPAPEQRKRMAGFFYKAQLFNWFSASTDKLIEGLHGKIKSCGAKFPLEEIKSFFKGYKRDVETSEENISGSRVRAMILNLVYREKFGASLFNSQFPGNYPNIDHIYPRSRLKSLGLRGDDINHLGNFRLVGASDNKRKRAENPDAHFSRMRDARVPVRDHLLAEPWASRPELMHLDLPTYRDFCTARAAEIFKMTKLIVDPEKHTIY
jgi:hypothetical protein